MAIATETVARPPFSAAQARKLISRHGGPLYVYDRVSFAGRARELLELFLPFGLTVRYAVKANPHPEIIELFAAAGLSFDASSSYEAVELLQQGIRGATISLSSQQPAHNLSELLEAGVQYVATSMHQLELFAKASEPGAHVALRVNAGLGSGHSKRTTTAGPNASFGLWHEYLDEALAYARSHDLVIDRLHTHIGTGADPLVWRTAIETSLDVAARMPDVTILDMGGGYKILRREGDARVDMGQVASIFADRLLAFSQKTGRRLHLEIEPGALLVANAGYLITEITDIVDTGKDGYTFLRINTGMNDFLRPTLHGGQHDLEVLNDSSEWAEYVVVGHNCESSDIITTAAGDPETIEPRKLRKAHIGDLLVIKNAGAYCASLRAKGYNSFPDAGEVVI